MKYIVIEVLLLTLIGTIFAAQLNEDMLNSIHKQKRSENLVIERCHPNQIGPFTLIGAQFDRFLTKQLYVGGTAYGAIDGGRSGYALGAFQIGWIQPISAIFFLDTKILIGGSGGGGVPVTGGLFVEPVIALGWLINPWFDIRFGYGKYYSMDNDFEADVINFSLNISAYHLFIPID